MLKDGEGLKGWGKRCDDCNRARLMYGVITAKPAMRTTPAVDGDGVCVRQAVSPRPAGGRLGMGRNGRADGRLQPCENAVLRGSEPVAWSMGPTRGADRGDRGDRGERGARSHLGGHGGHGARVLQGLSLGCSSYASVPSSLCVLERCRRSVFSRPPPPTWASRCLRLPPPVAPAADLPPRPSDVARSQPHVLMAASSQYHRGATTAHSHYHALPGNHEHLYADLTTAWSSSHQGLSRSPAPSALLQRYGPPIHRSPAHYVDYSGPGDYVNHQQQPQPQPQPQTEASWGAQYSRPVVSLPVSQPVSQPVAQSAVHTVSQPWTSGLLDTAYTPRSLSYDQQDGRLPAPHINPRPLRQYQIASDSQQPVGSAHVYRPQDGQNDHDLTTVSAEIICTKTHLTLRQHLTAPPNVHPPPFSADAPTLAPVASILNYATPELHAAPSQVQSQAVVPWGHDSGSLVSPTTSQHGFNPTGHHIQAQATLGTQNMLRGPAAWDMNQASGVYETVPEPTPMWAVDQNAQSLDQMQHDISEPTLHARNGSRGKRSPPKKNAAKVPAAFVARQKKSKVSKRKGPLDEAGRQKTHRMRKEKLSCLRCRFYKSGVSHYSCNMITADKFQCDQGEPCQKCQKAVGNARSFKLECTRGRLEDAMLVRHCMFAMAMWSCRD